MSRGFRRWSRTSRNWVRPVIDLGGGATGLSIFIKKHMIYADAVRWAASMSPRTSPRACRSRTATAERIKCLHGGVHATGKDDREMIEIGGDSGDWEKDRRTDQPRRTDRDHAPAGRGDPRGRARPARCGGLRSPAQPADRADRRRQPDPRPRRAGARILGQQVRLGRPIRVHGLPQAATGPAFSALVGLCMYAAHPQDEWWDFEIPPIASRRGRCAGRSGGSATTGNHRCRGSAR
jgi:cell division protein FtsA